MLGSAKAGRIFIPLDLAFPENYLADTIADSGASLILADRESLPLANRIKGRAEVISAELGDPTERTPDGKAQSGRRRPCLYSVHVGSTGKAKGVVLSHEFLLRYVNVWSSKFGIGPGDRMSLLFSCNWGTGMHNTFTALLCGACVCPFEIRKHGVAAYRDG
jgi:acyl-coenzyme A synthetase/AMP-(fatty) acid ligase